MARHFLQEPRLPLSFPPAAPESAVRPVRWPCPWEGNQGLWLYPLPKQGHLSLIPSTGDSLEEEKEEEEEREEGKEQKVG